MDEPSRQSSAKDQSPAVNATADKLHFKWTKNRALACLDSADLEAMNICGGATLATFSSSKIGTEKYSKMYLLQ